MKMGIHRAWMRGATGLCLAFLSMLQASCGGWEAPERRSVPQPRVQPNPQPSQIYDVTVTIEAPYDRYASPRPGVLDYDIENYRCVPIDYTKALGGTWPSLRQTGPLYFKVDERNALVTRVFRDALLPQDYYGLGVCRWQTAQVSSVFSLDRRQYQVALSDEDLVAGRAVAYYCLKPEIAPEITHNTCVREVGAKNGKFGMSDRFKVVTVATKR